MNSRTTRYPIRCFVAGMIFWTICLISGHAAGSEQTPWRSHENGTLYTGLRWDYTLGYTFRPLVDGTITAVAGYFDGTRKVTLWDENRNRVREAHVTSHDHWAEVPLADPFEVKADRRYWITVYAAGGGASYRRSTNRWPQIYDNIEIGGYCYAGGDAFPTYEGTYGYMYGQVDIRFASGGSDPTIPPWERWSRIRNRWEQTAGRAPIRVAILAEAFTATEIGDFRSMTDEIRKWFYQVEPYNTVGYERIDLYRVNAVSNQSGIGADTADARDTAFKARRDLLVAKTIKPTDYESMDHALSLLPGSGAYATVYCMVCNTANLNHDARARAWMPPFLSSSSEVTDRGCVTNSDPRPVNGVPEYARTAIHELGHAIGSLGDEYPGGNGEPFIPRRHYQNISAYDDLVKQKLETRKWYQWLGVPWKGATIGTEAIGNGWYRPTNHLCIMQHQHYDAFCPVCKEHLAAMILSACGHVAMDTPYRDDFETIGSTGISSSAGSPDPRLNGCTWNQDSDGPIDGGSVHGGSASLNYNDGSAYACGHNSGTAITPLVYIGDLVSPTLSFYYNYDAETGQLYDRRYVEILKWDSTYRVFRWATEPIQLHGESKNIWHYKRIDLDPSWEFIAVRFRFDTGDDFLNNQPGWFIDDLRIGE